MLEALSLAVDTTYLDGVMVVCDPCSGHISTENGIWMMVVMVVMPLDLMPLCRWWSPPCNEETHGAGWIPMTPLMV